MLITTTPNAPVSFNILMHSIGERGKGEIMDVGRGTDREMGRVE